MLVSYFDPIREIAVDQELINGAELALVLEAVADLQSACGRTPAVELNCDDGSSLMIATVSTGAVLSWNDGLGSSYHSVGDPTAQGVVVFDYFGSYTEVPQMFVVDQHKARRVAISYLETGRLVDIEINMEPD